MAETITDVNDRSQGTYVLQGLPVERFMESRLMIDADDQDELIYGVITPTDLAAQAQALADEYLTPEGQNAWLNDLRGAALSRYSAHTQKYRNGLVWKYPQGERDTWPLKYPEAKAHLAGDPITDMLYLNAIVTERGLDAAQTTELCNQVMTNAETYANAIAAFEAYRVQAEADYTAAASEQEIADAESALLSAFDARMAALGVVPK